MKKAPVSYVANCQNVSQPSIKEYLLCMCTHYHGDNLVCI